MPLCPLFPLSQGSPTFLGPPGGSQEPLPVPTHPLPFPSAPFEWQLLSPALFLPSWQRTQILKGIPGQPGCRFCARQTAFWGPHFPSFLAPILKGARLLPGRAQQSLASFMLPQINILLLIPACMGSKLRSRELWLAFHPHTNGAAVPTCSTEPGHSAVLASGRVSLSCKSPAEKTALPATVPTWGRVICSEPGAFRLLPFPGPVG